MSRYDMYNWDTNSVYNPTRMNHIEQGIYDADLREGGTITGDLVVDEKNGTTSAVGNSYLIAGNNVTAGTNGNSRGRLRLFSNNNYRIDLMPSDNLTGNRNIFFPVTSENDTLAMRSDMHTILARITPNANETVAQIIQRLRSTYWGDWATDIKKYGIIGMTIDGVSSSFFKCYRFVNNSTANYVCLHPSSTSMDIYALNFGSNNATSVRKWSISASGTTYSDISTSLADGELIFQSINI